MLAPPSAVTKFVGRTKNGSCKQSSAAPEVLRGSYTPAQSKEKMGGDESFIEFTLSKNHAFPLLMVLLQNEKGFFSGVLNEIRKLGWISPSGRKFCPEDVRRRIRTQ